MNRLSDIHYTTESYLFPMVEEEIGSSTVCARTEQKIEEN